VVWSGELPSDQTSPIILGRRNHPPILFSISCAPPLLLSISIESKLEVFNRQYWSEEALVVAKAGLEKMKIVAAKAQG
jgi:hypothetical protein